MLRKLGNFSVLLVICALFISMCGKREQFTIKGNVEGFADSTKLYLKNLDAGDIVDSTMVLDSTFTFKGRVGRTKPFYIYQKNNRGTLVSLWVENSEITIDGSKKDFRNAKITGSEVQKQSDSLQEKLEPIRKKWRLLGKKFRKLKKQKDTPKEKMRTLRQKNDSLRNEMILVTKNYIAENPEFLYSGYQLQRLMKNLGNTEVDSLYNLLSKDIQSSVYGKKVKKYLEISRNFEKGDKAADFTLPNVEGDSLSLSDYKDEYVLLDFWAS